jgi:hypothetical protein
VAARHLLEFAIKTWSATSYVVTEYGDEAEMVGVTRNDGTKSVNAIAETFGARDEMIAGGLSEDHLLR